MSKLGDFLEVVFGPTDGFQTVRASIRHWRNRTLAENASSTQLVMGKRKAKSGSPVQIDETLMQVWIERPGRFRVETEHRDGDGVRSHLNIVNGDQAWTRDDQGHVEDNKAEDNKAAGQKPKRAGAGATAFDRHFSHASLREFFLALALEPLSDVRTAGQDCLRLCARPRPDGRLWPHWLPYGADEYEFDVLPARGVVLAIQARRGGEVFEINEVTDVAFDTPIDNGLFHYIPAYGEQVRPTAPIIEHLSLETAIRRMPFTVLVPNPIPNADHAQLDVMYHPPSARSSRPYLTLSYRWTGLNQSLRLHESATLDSELEQFEWEHVVRHGGRELRLSDPNVEGGYRGVALEQEGTYETIWSDIAREPLLDLAASLVPAAR